MFPEVNPAAESTWKNHPRPCNFPGFERALRELGGEHATGHQNLILRWAPDHFRFQLGRPRLYYVDTRIPTRKRLNRIYYQVRLLRDPLAPWITITPEQLGNFPEGRYLHLVHHDAEIVTIARQQWVVEQYFPPERIVAEGDTPELWEKRRHRFFTPPETNVPIYGDSDGPFPSEGQYRSVFILEASDREYGYRPPCERDLDVLRQAFAIRDTYRRTLSRQQEIANEYARMTAAEQKLVNETNEQLKDELKPYDRKCEGNAFVAVPDLSNVQTAD
jgi:hypothetical protein